MAIMKGCEGYEGSKQPFTMVKHCILVGYIVLMKGEGLTNEFIDIYNYYVRISLKWYRCSGRLAPLISVR